MPNCQHAYKLTNKKQLKHLKALSVCKHGTEHSNKSIITMYFSKVINKYGVSTILQWIYMYINPYFSQCVHCSSVSSKHRKLSFA